MDRAHLSRHCFPIRPGKWCAIVDHRDGPCFSTTAVRISSSAGVHAFLLMPKRLTPLRIGGCSSSSSSSSSSRSSSSSTAFASGTRSGRMLCEGAASAAIELLALQRFEFKAHRISWLLYRTEARSPGACSRNGGRKKASQSRIRHAVGVQEVGAREDQREPQPVEAAVAYAKQNLKVVP